ncbi:M67 family metallopeptidase [Paenibacillus hexagrammi]|uniref:M67 family metallopeptidase n=1 Tax=Paenibacillus hexagrammi TaxID=2908839 RepID=UPI0033130048
MRKELLNSLIKNSCEKLPAESCGFLLGNIQSRCYEVLSFIPVPNISKQSQTHFTMDPAVSIPILTNATHSILGIYHSHPTAAAEPSSLDTSTLWHTFPLYGIISLQNADRPHMQFYEIKKAAPISFNKLSFESD